MMRKQRELAGQAGGAGVQGEEKKRRREEKRKGEGGEGGNEGGRYRGGKRNHAAAPGKRKKWERERERGPKAASVCDDTSVLPPVPTNLCLYYKLPFQTKAESRT